MVIYSHAILVSPRQSAVDGGLSVKPRLVHLRHWQIQCSADPDQKPQNAVSDESLHCLLKLQEVKV